MRGHKSAIVTVMLFFIILLTIPLNTALANNTFFSGNMDIVYVHRTGNNITGNGTFAEPFASISMAYSVVADGGTIAVLSNLDSLNFPATVTLNLSKTVTITSYSGDGVKSLVPFEIMPGNFLATEQSLFIISNGHIILENITLNAQFRARAFYVGSNGALTIGTGATITRSGYTSAQNRFFRGGGVFVRFGGVLNLKGGTISGNISAATPGQFRYGGGIYLENGATLNLYSGSITANYSGHSGGGIFTNPGSYIHIKE